jgi:hypothetical protein
VVVFLNHAAHVVPFVEVVDERRRLAGGGGQGLEGLRRPAEALSHQRLGYVE